MTPPALSRHPAVQRFVQDYAEHRFETQEGELFELLWRIAQRWSPLQDPEARSMALLELADGLAELGADTQASPAALEELFAAGAPPGSRLIVARHARPLLQLLADHATNLAIARSSVNSEPSSPLLDAFEGSTMREASTIIARFHTALASRHDPQRDPLMTALLARRDAAELASTPWIRAGEPVWSAENARPFAVAIVQSAYMAYLYGPTLSGQSLCMGESVWALLDYCSTSKAVEAFHFARFGWPNLAGASTEDVNVRDDYVRAVQRLVALQPALALEPARHAFSLRKPGDLVLPRKRDAVEFAVRLLASETAHSSEKERLQRLRELLAPFDASDEVAKKMLQDVHRRRSGR